MLKSIHLTVNGQQVHVAVEEGECLTEFLRERLGLTSVKRGCEVGECGACAVLVDGVSVNSCIFLASRAQGKHITTLEGLSQNGQLHPLQQAFIEEGAIQCGFCTPGFLMTGVEILSHRKQYTREELKALYEGHFCRCTGYEPILNAIERVLIERENAS